MKSNVGITLTVAAGLLAVSSFVAAQQPAPAVGDVNPAVLKVNDDLVYASEISMVMQNIASQAQAAGQPPNQEQLVQAATQRIVEQKLLAQEAVRVGIKVDELRLAEMAKAIEDQAGGRATLDANLAQMGSNYEQLQNTLREMDLVRSYIEQEIVPTVQVTEQEVTAFYTENPEMFERPEQVHARHILFDAAEDAEAQVIVDARGKADDARKRALAGEDFAELAREVSEGPSAPNGGDLGFFAREQMVQPFSEAAFALQVGQISEVVRTQYGFHVIKVEERRDAGTVPLEEASDRLETMLQQQKVGRMVNERMQSLASKATITPLMAPQPPEGAGAAAPGN
jgi:peptidyl-prolyl cis-trans isomerase C